MSKEKSTPTICLNMIVKNESKIIERFLDSVFPFIDSYCICDTGSTDDTVGIIEKYFQNTTMKGKVIQEPFRDFEYNRTFSLLACSDIQYSDYLLLLDADMVLKFDKSRITEIKQSLYHDTYMVYQGTEDFHYGNIRLVKNNRGFVYWGVTHEYIKSPEKTTSHTLEKKELFILDIGDGGCKDDKFERDIRLLTNGLITHPNNDRYTFYLANSYRDKGDNDQAIHYYLQRIELKGWMEEIWYSYYMIGNCYRNKNEIEKAIFYWLEAYQIFPNRIENLYKVVHYYRIMGKYKLANMYYLIADKERTENNKWEYLFTELDVYNYRLDYEMSIMGYYSNTSQIDLLKTSMKLLANYSLDNRTNLSQSVLSNYKFYAQSLLSDHSNINILPSSSSSSSIDSFKRESNIKLLQTIGKNIPEIKENGDMMSSTPSICYGRNEKELLVVVRYVNYHINEKGHYINKKNITTINIIAMVDISSDDWCIKTESILEYNTEEDDVYIGQEDVRLHRMKNKDTDKIQFTYNTNRCLSKQGHNHEMTIEHGIIEIEEEGDIPYYKESCIIKKQEYMRPIEKNWVLFDNEGVEKCIYKWYPLTIGQINTEKKEYNELISNSKVPYFFKDLRGSSNGVVIGNEIWFICHLVSYEDCRHYYHIMVVLDKDTLVLKSYTNLFTFENKPVEYCLGMICVDDYLFLGYSVMDRESKYIPISLTAFESEMIYF